MAIEEELTGSTAGRVQGDFVNGNSVVIDHNHPLYFSSSDVPGALSVGIQLTGMENYTLWSRAMKITLLGRNKVGFIDGSVLRTDFDGDLKKIWDRCNVIILSWLTCNVSKDLLSGFSYSSSANQVWLDLKERFDKARGQILMMSCLPNVNQAYSLIIQDERQKGIAGSVHEEMESLALYTARHFRSPQPNTGQAFCRRNFHSLFCDFRNMKEHTRVEFNKLNKCDHCNATEHVKADCFQLIGYPEYFKGKKKDQMAWKAHTIMGEKSNRDMSLMGDKITHDQLLHIKNKSSPSRLNQILNKSAHMAGKNSYLKWIIDTGATDHMIHDHNKLHSESKVGSIGRVQLPTGDSTMVSHMGRDSELTPCVVLRSAVTTNVTECTGPFLCTNDEYIGESTTDVGVFSEDPVLPYTKGILKDNFKIKELGDLRYFLGIEFARNDTGILMHQRKYCFELISDMGLSSSRPVGASFEINHKLTTAEFDLQFPSKKNGNDKLLDDPGVYQKLVGRLFYLTMTRPDIAFAVLLLSQFMHSPKTSHMEAAMRVVRYVKHSLGLGILMSSNATNQLTSYCDANWAACPNNRRSIT
uniref:Retrotransposon Copia-like N-terminal domain-containing protein n=1 Tax=Solanum lycopersicum TaxID=4081 RepID=A0A3Q7JBE5_SOLLC